MKFNHLNVPDSWRHYWTKYPEGYTILEALISWVSQVDDMTDNMNKWNDYLDGFVAEFDTELQNTVTTILQEWNASGFLGEVIDEAIQTKLDTLEKNVTDDIQSLNTKTETNRQAIVTMKNGLGKTYSTLSELQTNHPTGDTKDHVVAENGHRYYWDGNEWADGGLWNAVQLGTDSVSEKHTTFFANNSLIKADNVLLDKTLQPVDGAIVDGSDRVVTDKLIPVTAGKTYFIGGGYFRIAFFDSEGAHTSTLTNSTNKEPYEFLNPATGFVRISYWKEFYNNLIFGEKGKIDTRAQYYSLKPTVESVNETSVLPNTIKPYHTNFIRPAKNLLNPAEFVKDHLLRIYAPQADTNSGEPIPTSGYYTSGFIRLTKGTPFYLSYIRIYNIYTLGKKLIYGVNLGSNDSELQFTPEYDCYIRVSFRNSYLNSVMIEQGTTKTSYEPYKLVLSGISTDKQDSPLAGKTIANLGDSIAAGESQTENAYAKLIANKEGMTYDTLAQHGASIGEQAERGKITAQVDAIVSSGKQYDYILWNGGTNDSASPTGVLTEGYNDPLDKTTLIGGAEYICKTLRENFPTSKIIYIRVHNMSSRSISSQERIGENILAVCHKWSIPVVDLYEECGLNTNITGMATNFTLNGDATHPTYEAYDIFYVPQITAKMKSI